jgi:hypothetical protein
MTESMELVLAYEPLGTDSQGITTVKAACVSAQVKRTTFTPKKSRQKDAVESLKGKTFILKVAPSGMLTDKSQLREVIMQLGEKAFAKGRRKIKDPDMIFDFIATQWFLWNSTSSIESPASGVAVGQSWSSRLLVPLPIPMRTERQVVYELDEVRRTDTGRVAVINSSYSPADSAAGDWPMPYGGRFQMRGMFGFFRGYEIVDLSGEGTEIFNLDAGVVEQVDQNYKVGISAVIPFALGDADDEEPKPNITIDQQITMQLLNSEILTQ